MGTFFIVTEISGLNQMMSIENHPASEIVQKSERIINNALKAKLEIRSSFLIFIVDASLEKSSVVMETSVNLLNLLGKHADELHEFSMALIYKREANTEKFFLELKRDYFLYCEDFSLVIQNKIYKTCGLKLLNDKNYQVLKCNKEEKQKHNNSSNAFTNLEDEKKFINLVSSSLYSPEAKIDNSNIYFVDSHSEIFTLHNIKNALTKSIDNTSQYFVHIDIVKSENDVIMPLFRSIDYEMLDKVEVFLKKTELEFWQNNQNRIDTFVSDCNKNTFFTIYLLYLHVVFRIAEQNLNPKIIIISGISKESEDFFEYFSFLFKIINKEFSPILFLIPKTKDVFIEDSGIKRFFPEVQQIKSEKKIKGIDNYQINNYQQKLFVYILKITEGILKEYHLKNFLNYLGYSNDEILENIDALVSQNLIIYRDYIKVFPDTENNHMFSGLYNKEETYIKLAEFLYKLLIEGVVFDFALAAERLKDFTGKREVDNAICLLLGRLIELNKTDYVLSFLENCKNISPGIEQALKLRARLITANLDDCKSIIKVIVEKQDSPNNIDEAYMFLEVAKYYYAVIDYQKSLDIAKKLLLFIQFGNTSLLEGVVLLEIGFIMLCRGRLIESSDYLSISIEKLSTRNDAYTLVRAYLLSSLQQYIWGSYDVAIETSEKSSTLALKSGCYKWYFVSNFFTCRLLFELGRYSEAETLLWDCLIRNEVIKDKNREKVLKAWLARACIYQGKIYRGLNMLLYLDKDPEVLFFLSEAYYLNKNIKKALKMIKKTEDYSEYFNSNFLPMEHIEWKDGFSLFEGRVFRFGNNNDVLFKNIKSFYAFLQCLNGNREYGIEVFTDLTKAKNLTENDPFNRLYYNLYCQIVANRDDGNSVDKLTIMSKALKYLQQTASRIKKPSVRQQFMNKNYWNAILVKDAINENLI